MNLIELQSFGIAMEKIADGTASYKKKGKDIIYQENAWRKPRGPGKGFKKNDKTKMTYFKRETVLKPGTEAYRKGALTLKKKATESGEADKNLKKKKIIAGVGGASGALAIAGHVIARR